MSNTKMNLQCTICISNGLIVLAPHNSFTISIPCNLFSLSNFSRTGLIKKYNQINPKLSQSTVIYPNQTQFRQCFSTWEAETGPSLWHSLWISVYLEVTSQSNSIAAYFWPSMPASSDRPPKSPGTALKTTSLKMKANSPLSNLISSISLLVWSSLFFFFQNWTKTITINTKNS